jgi:hypothetical protein
MEQLQPKNPGQAVPDIELPACFYLGREYDLASHKTLNNPLMYDANDLTTHGVVVGMTGSGKTGLCINLLEEAAIDGISCIIIDPKGDLTNLLLQFPELDPTDFLRWLNPEDARQRGMPLEQYARQVADKWRSGLAEWGQEPQRIARLKASSEWRIYTPGSEAGLPLSILGTFTAPKGETAREALNQKIDATTTALLGLTGITGDPVQSREHILIAQLLLHAWTQGQDLDLQELIAQIQTPPLNKIGAFDVDTFFPEKDRLKLAVALNNILAAPSFSTWITGETLDLSRMLNAPAIRAPSVSAGSAASADAPSKPRQLIFYIAHLEDAQRLFFLTLLLEEVLSWTRKQPGTTSLRAILYFDEVFGYLPPHPANPPTKLPLMTLLKQARAFGVGVLLATQNPVDLDYKALSNAGTWFVGKLQTERDKGRLIEGLEGVAAERGTLTDKSYLETVISALGNRVFLLHDVHRGQPMLFQSRHALSFLRGPMTREQVALLMGPLKKELAGLPAQPVRARPGDPVASPAPVAIRLCARCRAPVPPGNDECPGCGEALHRPAHLVEDREFKQNLQRAVPAPAVGRVEQKPPEVAEGVAQYYLPLSGPVMPAGAQLLYQARLLGFAEVVFHDKRRGIQQRIGYQRLAKVPAVGQAVRWVEAEKGGDTPVAGPQAGAHWVEVPEVFQAAKKVKALEKAFADFLYDNAKLTIRENARLELVGKPGDDVLLFRERCRAAAWQEAEKSVAAEKLKYQPKFEALGAKVPESIEPAKGGGSLLDIFNPLKWLSNTSKAQSPPRLTARQLDSLRRLEADWWAKRASIFERWKQIGEECTEIQLTPRRADVQISKFGLAWVPFWQFPTVNGGLQLVAAYR